MLNCFMLGVCPLTSSSLLPCLRVRMQRGGNSSINCLENGVRSIICGKRGGWFVSHMWQTPAYITKHRCKDASLITPCKRSFQNLIRIPSRPIFGWFGTFCVPVIGQLVRNLLELTYLNFVSISYLQEKLRNQENLRKITFFHQKCRP